MWKSFDRFLKELELNGNIERFLKQVSMKKIFLYKNIERFED